MAIFLLIADRQTQKADVTLCVQTTPIKTVILLQLAALCSC
jgi:hypothetical protein